MFLVNIDLQKQEKIKKKTTKIGKIGMEYEKKQ